MLFSYKFFTFSQLLNKFYNRKFQNIHFNPTKNQNKNIFRTYTSYISGRRSKKEGEIEGTRDISGKREIRVDGGQWLPDRVGLGVEWSGLVVCDGQISDVEREGEEELRKKREKRGRRWGGVI